MRSDCNLPVIKRLIESLLIGLNLLVVGLQNLPADVIEYTAPIHAEAMYIETIEEKVDRYALKYGVSKEVMHKVIKCESGYNVNIQSQHPDPTGPNGKEDSWGLVQIHLPAHPQITREQAIDPDFALTFLAENLSKGKGRMWSCYKMLPSKDG